TLCPYTTLFRSCTFPVLSAHPQSLSLLLSLSPSRSLLLSPLPHPLSSPFLSLSLPPFLPFSLSLSHFLPYSLSLTLSLPLSLMTAPISPSRIDYDAVSGISIIC